MYKSLFAHPHPGLSSELNSLYISISMTTKINILQLINSDWCQGWIFGTDKVRLKLSSIRSFWCENQSWRCMSHSINSSVDTASRWLWMKLQKLSVAPQYLWWTLVAVVSINSHQIKAPSYVAATARYNHILIQLGAGRVYIFYYFFKLLLRDFKCLFSNYFGTHIQ